MLAMFKLEVVSSYGKGSAKNVRQELEEERELRRKEAEELQAQLEAQHKALGERRWHKT